MTRPSLDDLAAQYGPQPAPYNGTPTAGRCPQCKKVADQLFEFGRSQRWDKKRMEFRTVIHYACRRCLTAAPAGDDQ